MDLFNEESGAANKSGKGLTNPHSPLATRMRPCSLDEFVGQDHIVGEGKMLHRMIESGVIGSLVFYGPPSSGKTTLAHVISREINAEFEILNAVLDGIKDLRQVVEKAEKIQQITLIGATTENPFYSLVSPLLSRCQLFELYDLQVEHVLTMIDRSLKDQERGLGDKEIEVTDDAKKHLAEFAGGDIRNAINALEIGVLSSEKDEEGIIHIDLAIAKECIQKRSVRYDSTGDEHYHYASAFIKSMRGSDPDAALYWMVAMLEGGDDPNFIFRRMLILASEDVGMADPHALSLVNNAHEAFTKCGMPEGFYFLAHACIYLALAPKSNSTGAIFSVRNDIQKQGIGSVPPHLQDKTANSKKSRYLDVKNASEDYKYPHAFDHHWIDQQYLPEEKEGAGWYKPGNIGREGKLWERIHKIKEAYKKSNM